MLPDQPTNGVDGKHRGIGKGLPSLQKEVTDPVPGPPSAVHVQCGVMTSDVLSHGLCCPSLVLLLLWEVYIESPDPADRMLSRCANQR